MTVDELCQVVMAIRPNNFMAMNGAAAGILGSADSGSDALFQLQRATLHFADIYKRKDPEKITAAKQEVIAQVMVARTLDTITEQKADQIAEAVTELTQAMQGKRGKN